ncbi:MAG: phosphate ABC transporter ATP-binding protein PstB [Pseudomonadales bacterium]|jgi:phosphate transport system ATP-binding protein|nr:phosphate ABC transporter ATP-binding protein PstB [Pseudomonadales bacterium]
MTAVQREAMSVQPSGQADAVIDCRIRRLHYGDFLAVRDSELPVRRGAITGLIGPSGCGKSTVLRCFNRTNDLIPEFRLDGEVRLDGHDIYAREVDPVRVRRLVGMVFQQPNPFAMSVFDNVAFGLRLNGFQGDLMEQVERALREAALWEEVKDKLRESGLALSGGQQQRLCIARAIATRPSVLLMDEPCSALDPVSTRAIEELMLQLREDYSIALVTHNMQQAQRVADYTAFFAVELGKGGRTGYLVEYGETSQLFEDPRETLTREYMKGKFS